MVRTKKTGKNKKLTTVGGRRIDRKLSVVIRQAVDLLERQQLPPPENPQNRDRATDIQTIIAAAKHNSKWYYIVKWKEQDEITIMEENVDLSATNFINAVNLFHLPRDVTTFEAVRITIGDLYDINGNLLCKCPFPQVTDDVDGQQTWYYIPEFIAPEACLRLHVALFKAWGTPTLPMQPEIPIQMPSIYSVCKKGGRDMILFSGDTRYYDISLLSEPLDEATSQALQKCVNNGAHVRVPQGCRVPGARGCTRDSLLHFGSFFTKSEINTISNSMGDFTSLDRLSEFFSTNPALNKNGLSARGPSEWYEGRYDGLTDFVISKDSRRVGLIIANIEDIHGNKTHNISIDCKNRVVFDPDKFYCNRTWPLTRETFEKLKIKRIHAAKQIYRRPGSKTLKVHKTGKTSVKSKIKGAALPLYLRR